MKKLMLDSPGKRILVLGDEAIVRGALEAGVNFVTTYPGAPASEVADAFADIVKEIPEIYFEYSTNEAIATGSAFGGAWSGANALVCFKMLGLNVAADYMQCATYAGTKPGGLVIAHAGDPGLISSTNEADNRDIFRHMGIPIFEPSSIQEAKDFTKEAFPVSKKYDLPVAINFNTRLAHSMGDIELGPLAPIGGKGRFKPDKTKYLQGSMIGLQNHKRLFKRLKKVTKYAAKSPLNKIIPGDSKIGVIAGGMSFGYVLEALDACGLEDIPIFRPGIQFPLDAKQVLDFCNDLESVVIVEELEPFLEDYVKQIAFDGGLKFKIYGKNTFPRVDEFSPDIVIKGIMKAIEGAKPKYDLDSILKMHGRVKSQVTARMPTFCAGCPHRATAYALKKAIEGKDVVVGADIGCYALTITPPTSLGDWLICMSSGAGIGQGISHRDDRPIFTFMGDSTFFHTGMQAVLNAVYTQANLTVIIMDNRWTALTGHQPLPHTGVNSLGEPFNPIKIADVCRAFGVKYIRVVDAYNIKTLENVFRQCLKVKGPKVVISSRECNIQVDRRERREEARGIVKPVKSYYRIIPERCQQCDECLLIFGCVAIRVGIDEDGNKYYYIEDAKCTNCGVCKEVCPNSAIVEADIITNI
ncbi:MAG: thiamine pyrophosphate-dependent enzyme [Candidatus Helarchaeota archaeon]